jgi:deoxyadenosine/deoxycytidine kinase
MGNLVVVVGNTGVGKTTLVNLLSEKAGLIAGLEGHTERPFQTLFKRDHEYAFANQVDYLMLRSEQEKAIRSGDCNGIMDGGLEMDYLVFSRLFHHKGWLNDSQYALLGRIYTTLRSFLPPPEMIIFMYANPEIITKRYRRRGRHLEIATVADIQMLEGFLENWLDTVSPDRVISFDASADDPFYHTVLPALLEKISTGIGISSK